jgi:hypothetical protein
MIKEVVLLKHINLENNDIKVLGCFYKSDLESTVNFYKTLSGFSDNNGGFDYSVSIAAKTDSVFLLQIWERDDDETVLFVGLYNTQQEADTAFDSFLSEHQSETYESIIEKYTINEKQWSEGFITIYD